MALRALRKFGDFGQFALPIGSGLYALYNGHIIEGFALGVSAGVQQIVLYTLKKCIHAPRPHSSRFDSFPSGHTAGAFLAVGFILPLDFINSQKTEISFLNTANKICITALAVIVGLSRYLCNRHWCKDVIAGGSLGVFFGSAAVCIPYLINHS